MEVIPNPEEQVPIEDRIPREDNIMSGHCGVVHAYAGFNLGEGHDRPEIPRYCNLAFDGKEQLIQHWRKVFRRLTK